MKPANIFIASWETLSLHISSFAPHINGTKQELFLYTFCRWENRVSMSQFENEPGLDPGLGIPDRKLWDCFLRRLLCVLSYGSGSSFCLRSLHPESCNPTCSALSKSFSFPDGNRKQEKQRAARPTMCKHSPSPGWHSKPPSHFQPSQREGSAAARTERLQPFSRERVRWSVTCTNCRFSLWETSWQELGAGVADTWGGRTFFSL